MPHGFPGDKVSIAANNKASFVWHKWVSASLWLLGMDTPMCILSYSSATRPWNFNCSIFSFALKHNHWGIWVTGFHGSLQVIIKIVFAIYVQLQDIWRHFIPLEDEKELSWFSAIRYTQRSKVKTIKLFLKLILKTKAYLFQMYCLG